MSVDGNQLPPVMPATVPRVLPDGLATKFLIDWEQATSAFYTASLNDLQTQTNTVSANLGTTNANLTTEITARANGDSALAAQITTLTASYNNISANGQIYIAAVANPGGATAAFGIFLTAGNQFTGLTMIADSGGGSSVAIAASQFTFTDTGTATNVFSYSGGVFNFNVPVTIRNQDIGANAVSHSTGASGNPTASATVTVRTGARVSIIATFDGDPGLYNTLATYNLQISNATTATVLKTVPVGYFASGTGGSTVQRYFCTTGLAFDTPAAGANTYTAQLVQQVGGIDAVTHNMSIIVTELSK